MDNCIYRNDNSGSDFIASVNLYGVDSLQTAKRIIFVSADGKNVQILLTPQSVDTAENKRFDLTFSLDFAAEKVTVQRIDDTHCNPKRLWQELGSPDNLTSAQVEEIKEKSRLREEPLPFTASDGNTEIPVSLSTNDVLLITVKAGV